MGHLERSLDWLRPLVLGSNNTWDYCVVWKLGHDPSRFIEWVGCCCNGGRNEAVGSKRKNREKSMSIPACRDANYVHPANTKSCEVLARLPSSMSLYSGVHGEVVISSQPRWLNISNTADSKAPKEEFEGTQVLIPVIGGLIELFSTEHISENESIVEYVLSQFNISETETMSNSTITIDGPLTDLLLEETPDTCLSSIYQQNILPMARTMIQIALNRGNSTMGGSSTGSFPSPDSTPCSISQPMAFTQRSPCHKEHTVKEEFNENKKAEKKPCKSKNLLTERNRRKRISDGLLTLRSIVPKITKMHKAATLSDAIDYITELHNEYRSLWDEFELEDSNKSTNDMQDTHSNREIVEPGCWLTFNQKQSTSSLTKRSKSQVQVDVNQLGAGDFLVRVVCQDNPGAFTKMLEAFASLDVLLIDVNATVLDGRMTSNFIVQTNDKKVQEKALRDSLMLIAV